MIQNKTRSKKRIPEVIKIKEWYSSSEAMSFLDVSPNTFKRIIGNGDVSISAIGTKKYYKVSELKSLFKPIIEKTGV